MPGGNLGPIRKYAPLLTAACLLIGGYWLMLDITFQGGIVAGVIALIHPSPEACVRHEDGSRTCAPLPYRATADANLH